MATLELPRQQGIERTNPLSNPLTPTGEIDLSIACLSSGLEIDRSRAQVTKAIEQYCTFQKLGDDLSSDLKFAGNMVVDEVLKNARKHGNGMDESKTVSVRLSSTSSVDGRGAIVLSVSDQGKGFDPTKVPHPDDEANCARDSGRGVFFYTRFSSYVDFTDEGRTATLRWDFQKDGDKYVRAPTDLLHVDGTPFVLGESFKQAPQNATAEA